MPAVQRRLEAVSEAEGDEGVSALDFSGADHDPAVPDEPYPRFREDDVSEDEFAELSRLSEDDPQ